MKINKNIITNEGPREKIMRLGAKNLSNTELFAILLSSGTRKNSVFDLSRQLLKQQGSIRGVLSADSKVLNGIHGFGPAKTALILAVKEICCRYLREDIFRGSFIEDPQGVYDFLKMDLGENKREFFKVILLNRGNQVIHEATLFEGSVSQAAVHPREVIKYALDHYASALILVHNHPSGQLIPSGNDIALTKKMHQLCQAMQLDLLDHLIIGKNKIYSFKEHGIGFE